MGTFLRSSHSWPRVSGGVPLSSLMLADISNPISLRHASVCGTRLFRCSFVCRIGFIATMRRSDESCWVLESLRREWCRSPTLLPCWIYLGWARRARVVVDERVRPHTENQGCSLCHGFCSARLISDLA